MKGCPVQLTLPGAGGGGGQQPNALINQACEDEADRKAAEMPGSGLGWLRLLAHAPVWPSRHTLKRRDQNRMLDIKAGFQRNHLKNGLKTSDFERFYPKGHKIEAKTIDYRLKAGYDRHN